MDYTYCQTEQHVWRRAIEDAKARGVGNMIATLNKAYTKSQGRHNEKIIWSVLRQIIENDK